MFALPIAERTWRKDSSKVLSDMNSWLRVLLEKADVQASVELSDDGWFIVKGEGAKFTLNVLNKLCYYPVSVGQGEERTSKVSGIDSSKVISVIYPNENGRTSTTTITIKELMARLKVKGIGRSEFTRAFGIVERLPLSILPSKGTISDLSVNFFMDFLKGGLDIVLVLDLTPIEADEFIASKGISDNVVEMKVLTPLSYAFLVKLGVEPSSVRALLSEIAESIGARPLIQVLRWEDAASMFASAHQKFSFAHENLSKILYK
ncbi:MAG: DUF2110 family protein [Thaumarchaeota archaeon]|jgi:hypothetical protein|nr:DUF2110 family protein [Candidatus Terraquivivens yellowstonensis]MCL7394666.1 DUF2110 family protein [Candidatus Terraquivivens yellowstonensis]MCL7398425.1 DUF2110 family protein [Candidatus Terraquivivens yellowstonensis]MCL7400717.1 DUF2110 family protein [Candidatus Terraquivivens yellowstonensis]